MKTKKRNFYRGDIVWADLGQHPGSHILSGRHPCLIVRTDKSKGNVYTVIPGSSKERKKITSGTCAGITRECSACHYGKNSFYGRTDDHSG